MFDNGNVVNVTTQGSKPFMDEVQTTRITISELYDVLNGAYGPGEFVLALVRPC